MKKLFIITLISLLIISCGRDSPKSGFIVEKIVISHYDKGMCKYIGEGRTSGILSSRAMIYDSCGKFNIGDTIKFVK